MCKELLEAAQFGNIESLKSLLAKGANSQFRDQDGDTPLMLAALHGHLDIVKYLIENNFSTITEKGWLNNNVLMRAIEGGHLSVVEYLMLYTEIDLQEKNTHGQDIFAHAQSLAEVFPSKAKAIIELLKSSLVVTNSRVDTLCRGILENSHLRKVVVRKCPVNASCLLEIANALQKTKVEILKIEDSTRFYDGLITETFRRFIESLGKTVVHTLSLRGNQIGARLYDNPGLAFSALKSTRIRSLDLSDNYFNYWISSSMRRPDGCMRNGRLNTGEAYLDYQCEEQLHSFGRSLSCLDTLNLSDQSLTPQDQQDRNPALKALTHFASGFVDGSLKTLIMNNGCFQMNRFLGADKERGIFIELLEAFKNVPSITCLKVVNNALAFYSSDNNPQTLELERLGNALLNSSVNDLDFSFRFNPEMNAELLKILQNNYNLVNLMLRGGLGNNDDKDRRLQEEYYNLATRNRTLFIIADLVECTPLIRDLLKIVFEYYDQNAFSVYKSDDFAPMYDVFLKSARRPSSAAEVLVASSGLSLEAPSANSKELTPASGPQELTPASASAAVSGSSSRYSRRYTKASKQHI